MITRYALLLLLPLAACSVGMTANRHPAANTPGGATASAFLANPAACATCPNPIVGELLAASDSGVLLQADPRTVHFLHYTALRRLSVERLGNISSPGRRDDPERLRLVSRYPAGITPTVLQSLLRISTPDTVIVSR